MSVPQDEYTDEDVEESGAFPDPDVIHVTAHIDETVNTQARSADFGAWLTLKLAGNEYPQRILPYDPYRHKAVICINTVMSQPAQAFGSVAAPAAGTIIAQALLPAGTYSVNGMLQLSGTIGPAELNNFGFFLGAQQLGVSLNPAAAGDYAAPAATVIIPPGGAVLSIKAIGNATAGSVYGAMFLYASGAPGTELAYVGTKPQCDQKIGGQITPGHGWVIENSQELWLVPDGINAINVTMLIERWNSAEGT